MEFKPYVRYNEEIHTFVESGELSLPNSGDLIKELEAFTYKQNERGSLTISLLNESSLALIATALEWYGVKNGGILLEFV